jgi:hypothetical protein
MKKYLCLLAIIFCSGCNACVDITRGIDVYNNSEKTIFASVGTGYPDTTLIANNIAVHLIIYSDGKKDTGNYIQWVQPLQRGLIPAPSHTNWEILVKEYGTLMIFIFDGEVIGKMSWWELVERDYLVLQRYDLSLQDLEKLNWKVYYPPTKAMQDMKMFPPYEEE